MLRRRGNLDISDKNDKHSIFKKEHKNCQVVKVLAERARTESWPEALDADTIYIYIYIYIVVYIYIYYICYTHI